MDKYICLYLSKSLTHEEWEPVYEEAMRLANSLRLAELRWTLVRNIYTFCMVPCKEHEYFNLFSEPDIGWSIDAETMSRSFCKTFFLDKLQCLHEKPDADAGDPMYRSVCHSYDTDSILSDCHTVWDYQPAEGPVFYLVLAVGCLIADRLKDKAFLSGDIDRYDFVTAVLLANCVLEKEIELPDQCVKEALLTRLRKMQLSPYEQLNAFTEMFMGLIDNDLGKFIINEFSEEECIAFWKQRLSRCSITCREYHEALQICSDMGLDLKKLTGRDCDVSEVIEDWPDEDAADNENVKPGFYEQMKKPEKPYDIVSMDQFLKNFKKGSTVEPELLEKVLEMTAGWIKTAEDPNCAELMEKDSFELCQWLAYAGNHIFLTVQDWQKIYDDILSDKQSFVRYYPMPRNYENNQFDNKYISAMVLNDNFYEEMIQLCKHGSEL